MHLATCTADALTAESTSITDLARDPKSRLGSLLDRIALRGMSFAFETTLMPSADELACVRASVAPYTTPELRREPGAFFSFLAEPCPTDEARIIARRTIAGGRIVRRELAARYEPFADSAPDALAAAPRRDGIPFTHWMHDAPAPATVIALHGFTMGDPDTDAQALMAADWFGLGLDVVLPTLPCHGERTPPQARYSGELFASWHVGRLNEAVRQSVHDVRRVMTWLQRRSTAPIGLIGLSLGGYVASLLAGLSSEPAFVIPIAAPVRLGAFPSTLYARSRFARRMPPPLSPAELDEAYRVHSPLTHPLRIARERVLIVAGRGDGIVPPEQPLALWRHWDRPALHWYSGSHVTPFRRAEVFAAGAAHVRGLGIAA